MTTSSSPVRGRALLMSTAAASFVLSAALVAGPASAAGTCTLSGTTETCSGDFPTGISFPTTTDLTVVTDNTVTSEGAVTVTGTTGASVTQQNAGSVVQTATSTTGGIDVSSDTGNATINNTGTVGTTTASTPGLSALVTGGAGNATVTSTGTVTTSGAYSDGVDAVTHGTGNAAITVGNVSATGKSAAGVFAEATGGGTATVTVNQGATVEGAGAGGAGVVMGALPNAGGTATTALYNNGTITGGSGTGAYSVFTLTGGGPALIDNNAGGTINGPISLNGGVAGDTGNVVNNAGTWNVTGDSKFGVAGETNTLNNTGTIVVGPGVTAPTTITFTNLATLNNAGGVVDLTHGNSLNLGGAAFNGGTGSTLRVNANTPTGELIVGSTPTGSTRVVLADMPGTHPAMNLAGTTIVTGAGPGTGPSAGSFNMGAGVDQHVGFVDYRLAFTPGTATTASSYSIFGLPGPEVFEALNIPYALQDFWRHSAVAITQRQMSIRDTQVGQQPSRAEGWEFWAVPYGGEDYFKRPRTYSFGGFSFDSIGNHNDFVGLQVGADVLANWLGGHGYWGFTGGLEQQTTHFPGDDANNLYSLGGNFGMYGAVDWGGFYLNALGKVDFDNMNTNFATAGFSPNNTYKTYGAKGEIGYRWPWSGFYVEPSLRVDAIWQDTIDLHPAGAALAFNVDEPVVDAEAGGRIGTTLNWGNWMKVMPGQFNAYVGAWYADQWNGQNRMAFTTFGGAAPTTIGLVQPGTGQFIHMEYGLETADWYGGLKLFLKGENDFSGDSVGGWGAQAGVRFNF